ncbi:GntR family transcriptional regulator [Mollicutes bacterium LVI A0039]|nr:GntR family transcriptional regulator [Mollicutes bacterium LVI A0039]
MKKYQKIYDDIIDKINTGTLKIGEIISSENVLSVEYNTSRATVRRALEELEKNGLIIKQQGKGSIVVSNNIKRKTVLLILPNIFKYIFKDLIFGIENTLRDHGINLLIARSYNDQKIERDIIRTYISTVDAIILEPTQAQYTKYLHSKTYASLESKPTVCINSKLENFNIPSLIVDDFGSMKLLTEHIVKNHPQRILILSKTDDLQGYNRLLGTTEVLQKHPEIKYKVIEFTTYDEDEKIGEFSNVYKHYKPDCIIFYNDEYANSFLSINNINPVMDDLLITGFDDTEYSNGKPYQFLSPAHPKEQMGIDAANAIIDLLNGQTIESKVYEPNINFNK